MKKNIFICLAILCFFSATVSAQFSDLAKIEYVSLPESSDGGTSFSRFKALVNIPLKLKKEGSFLIIGAEYNFITFDADERLVNFDLEELSEFKQLALPITYTFKLNKDWRIATQVQPGFTTNLDINDITSDNGIISGTVVFIKDKKNRVDEVKKPYRLVIGLRVRGNDGFPVLPYISYYRKFHPKWSYNLGIPKMQLQYHLNERNRLKVIARVDAFRSNLQNDILIEPGSEGADRLRQILVAGGLRYEYKFTKNIEFHINASYIAYNSIELRNSSRDALFDFEEDSRLYIKTGLRFKLKP